MAEPKVENNGTKTIHWKGMSEILRPMEGGKGADVLIQPIKPHKDYSITMKTILADDREVKLSYMTIAKLIEFEMWEELNSFMYFLELKISEKGIGINAFLSGFTGIYPEGGVSSGIMKRKWGFGNRKNKPDEQQG